MNERQALDIIMKTLNIEHLKPKVKDLADQHDISVLTILSMAVEAGIKYKILSPDVLTIENEIKEKKEAKKRKIYNIYIRETKEKEKTKEKSILLNLKTDDDSNVSKVDADVKKRSPKRQIPKAWLDAYDRMVIEDPVLINYCQKKHGLDKHYAKTQFIAFVEWHMSMGSTFARWNYAFYKWVNKDLKWNGKPATHLQGSLIQSYQSQNTIEELFND